MGFHYSGSLEFPLRMSHLKLGSLGLHLFFRGCFFSTMGLITIEFPVSNICIL